MKCRFLNETVSPEDQAEKLGITVELYEKLVVVRKLYTDTTDSGRLAQAVSFIILLYSIFHDFIITDSHFIIFILL